jgi:hypothetical protein
MSRSNYYYDADIIPLQPFLSVYPEEEVSYSGLVDASGFPLVRYPNPIGFIRFEKASPSINCGAVSNDSKRNTDTDKPRVQADRGL